MTHDEEERKNELERRLISAAEKGDLLQVQEALAQGANVEASVENGNRALHFAAISHFLEQRFQKRRLSRSIQADECRDLSTGYAG